MYSELTRQGAAQGRGRGRLPAPVPRQRHRAHSPFWSAPGSGYQSHHAYPGGLCTHTGLNVRVSMALYDGYREVYDYMLDRDVVLAAQLPPRPAQAVGLPVGQGRRVPDRAVPGRDRRAPRPRRGRVHRPAACPAEIVVAQACAHNHPRTEADEVQVVGWLTAAAIIAGKDPVAYGLPRFRRQDPAPAPPPGRVRHSPGRPRLGAHRPRRPVAHPGHGEGRRARL